MADLILGTAALGGISYAGQPALRSEACIALIQRAYDLGIRHFDTSSFYGKSFAWLMAALGNQPSIVYHKTDEMKTGEQIEIVVQRSCHQIHRLLHHWRPEIPRWAEGFSCYSHDNVRTAHGMIVQQDWSLLNQSIFPEGCTYKMARSVFLRGALAQNHQQRQWALQAALHAADGVVIGPRSIAELEELVVIANPPHSTPWIPLEVLNLGLHPMTDLRTWPQK